jgi:PadR family transcriptional regulator PadR
MQESSLDVIRGTLDVLILKTLSWGPLHGYAISQIIQQQTDDALLVEEGALYPALYRMEAKLWIASEWGLSENNRRARYYRLTAAGRKRLLAETKTWERYAEAVAKILGATSRPQLES